LPSPDRSPTQLALRILKQAIKEELKYEYNWFRFFHFKADPTEPSPLSENFDEELIDRQKEIQSLAMILASASKGSSAILFLIGPVGSGRSSLVNFLLHLNKLADADSVETLLVPVKELAMYKPDRITDYLARYKQARLLILEDCQELGPVLADILRGSLPPAPLKVIVTTPAHLLALRQHDEFGFSWKTLPVMPLGEKDAISFMRNVLTRELEPSSQYTSLLQSESVLKHICEFGMGIPSMMLRLLRQSFIMAYTKDLSKLDEKIVDEIGIRGGYQAALEGIVRNKLGEKLFEVLLALNWQTNFALGFEGTEGATANQLEEELDVDRTTIAHYLSELNQMGLVTKYKRGKPVYYRLTEATQVAIELECLKRGA